MGVNSSIEGSNPSFSATGLDPNGPPAARAVDGEWTWVLTDKGWQAYSKGDCPPRD